MTSAFQAPWSLAETLVFAGLFPTLTAMLALAPKPEPVTLKVVPGAPLEGSSLMPAPSVSVTVGALVANVKGPDVLMLWGPAGAVGTIKGLDHLPWSSAETPEATCVPSKLMVMPVSLKPKPDPVAVTELSGEALVRSSESVGVTVKVA